MSPDLALRHELIDVDGVTLHLARAGAGPVVLFIHGFPETWYSWRHQLPVVARAGYTAVALDLRGAGQSSCPAAIEDYGIQHLAKDVAGVLDHLGCERAVLVGHDWGSAFVWDLARLLPDRTAGVVGLIIPLYLDRLPSPPIETNRKQYGKDRFMHVLYFQEPGVADAELAKDVRRTLTRMFWLYEDVQGIRTPHSVRKDVGAGFLDGLPDPKTLPPWLTESDLDHYVADFERTGFTGELNFYRCMDHNWRFMQPYRDRVIPVPALYLSGSWDEAANMRTIRSSASGMRELVPDLRGWVQIEECGHWLQQSAPEAVNIQLLGFLASIDRSF